jgi:hypothetical protein
LVQSLDRFLDRLYPKHQPAQPEQQPKRRPSTAGKPAKSAAGTSTLNATVYCVTTFARPVGKLTKTGCLGLDLNACRTFDLQWLTYFGKLVHHACDAGPPQPTVLLYIDATDRKRIDCRCTAVVEREHVVFFVGEGGDAALEVKSVVDAMWLMQDTVNAPVRMRTLVRAAIYIKSQLKQDLRKVGLLAGGMMICEYWLATGQTQSVPGPLPFSAQAHPGRSTSTTHCGPLWPRARRHWKTPSTHLWKGGSTHPLQKRKVCTRSLDRQGPLTSFQSPGRLRPSIDLRAEGMVVQCGPSGSMTSGRRTQINAPQTRFLRFFSVQSEVRGRQRLSGSCPCGRLHQPRGHLDALLFPAMKSAMPPWVHVVDTWAIDAASTDHGRSSIGKSTAKMATLTGTGFGPSKSEIPQIYNMHFAAFISVASYQAALEVVHCNRTSKSFLDLQPTSSLPRISRKAMLR